MTLDEAGQGALPPPKRNFPALVGPAIERLGDLIEAYLREKELNRC